MRTNPSIYDTEQAHNEIGQALHDAKRRLLDSHRKGVPFTDAAATFYAECENVFTRATARLQIGKAAQPTNNLPIGDEGRADDERLDKVHADIARQIRLAEQQMFKAHREGMSLHDALQLFSEDINQVCHELKFPGDTAKQSEATTDSEHDREARCKALAAAAVQGFDEKQELGLVSLLYELAHAPSAATSQEMAHTAMLSAFFASSGLHEDAIRLLIEKGGDV